MVGNTLTRCADGDFVILEGSLSAHSIEYAYIIELRVYIYCGEYAREFIRVCDCTFKKYL